MNNAKRAQIFLFDLISSTVIIVITLVIIFSYFTLPTQNTDLYTQNREIMTSLTQTKVNSLNNEEIRQFFINSQIRNVDNTVAQQIGEFYVTGQDALATNISEAFLEDFVLDQYNFNLTLINGSEELVLYTQVLNNIDFEDSSVASVTKRTVFGFTNSTDLFGPYVFELKLWQ